MLGRMIRQIKQLACLQCQFCKGRRKFKKKVNEIFRKGGGAIFAKLEGGGGGVNPLFF